MYTNICCWNFRPKESGPCAVCCCVWSAGGHTAGCVRLILLYVNVLLRIEIYRWIMVEGSCVCVIRGVMLIVGFRWFGHAINILCTFGWNLTKIRSAHHRITLRPLCAHLCTHSERNSTCTVTTEHTNRTHRTSKGIPLYIASYTRNVYCQKFEELLNFKDLLRIPDDGAVRKEKRNYIKWYPFWGVVVFGWCVLFSLCMDTVHGGMSHSQFVTPGVSMDTAREEWNIFCVQCTIKPAVRSYSVACKR